MSPELLLIDDTFGYLKKGTILQGVARLGIDAVHL